MSTDCIKAAFPTEAALCQMFADWVRAGGGTRDKPWTVYPETGEFDLLLVTPDGHQLGIEAKLRMNAKVLAQAIPSRWSRLDGPDWRGILVPAINDELGELAAVLGLVVFTPRWSVRGSTYATPREGSTPSGFQPPLHIGEWMSEPWHDFNPERRCELPPMVPNVPAGVPCPVKLTPWKAKALRVLAHLAVHGHITAREVRAHGLDPRRFCATDGWLQSIGDGKWTRGKVPAFDEQHPAEFAAIVESLKRQEAA